MATSPLDIELNKYWLLLTVIQKESLLDVIKSFTPSTETGNYELNEPVANYGKEDTDFPIEILQQLNWEQKDALISLVESFGIEIPGQQIDIEQYNKELDEAMARMDAGEFYTHEQVIEMSKSWLNGK
jgi:hypothetical protein